MEKKFYVCITKFCIFTGLLTVDASKRLTINELLQDEWLQGGPPSVFSATPLMTPTILSARPTLKGPVSAEAGVKQTFHAFHMATREGFRLLVSILDKNFL